MIDLNDCLVKMKPKVNNFKRANKCFDCKNALGGCSWSEADPETGRIRFEVPEGAVTERSWQRYRGEWHEFVHIISCPLFEKG